MLPASALSLVLAAGTALGPDTPDDALLTVAETSGFRATATHREVVDLLERIADRSPRVHLAEMGTTVEGRSIPLAIIADPPLADPAAAHASGKVIVLAFGNIHAGEVCGKEALLMLARELAFAPDAPLLEDVVVLLAPIYNADGNDRMHPDNRPGQVGPELGMGERPNTQGLDLNRDWVKLESPEAQAMVALLTRWDPHVTIDTHTTNGSHHRYVLTWAPPLNPSGYAPSIAFVRDELLPEVAERLRERTGFDTFLYGNFNRDHTVWSTYSAQPRFGGPYRGLRGQMSILSEAHAYAPYEDRVVATREFVREIFECAARSRERIVDLHAAARRDTIAAGTNPRPDDVVGIRHRPAASPRPAFVRGYEMIDDGEGRPRPTDVPTDHRVVLIDRFEPTLLVSRPPAYVLGPGHDAVVEKLRQHGIAVEPFEGEVVVERYVVRAIDAALRVFQGHRNVTLEVDVERARVAMPSGSFVVSTAQPLGTLAVYLLEPQSEDGLAAWNFFDDVVEVGKAFPVMRVAR